MRDGCGLHCCHEMVPAQGWPRGIELLVGRLVMLVGVHLREIITTGNLAQRGDQGFGSVPTIGVLLSQGRSLFDLVSASQGAEIHPGQPLASRETADAPFNLLKEFV